MNNTNNILEFHERTLILCAPDIKLLTHQDYTVAFARACFLNHLAAQVNIRAEIEAWLDCGMEHVSY